MSAFSAVFRRELALAWSAGGGALAPVGYFIGAAVLAAMALGADHELLRMAGPPLIWLAAPLAVLIILERLFQADTEDGALDQMLQSAAPIEFLVFAKAAALWLAIGAPLALAGLPVSMILLAPPQHALIIVLSLAIGQAAFIGIGLIGAAVAAGVRRGGVLIALIVLPLFAPPAIFGAQVAASGEWGPAFVYLCAYALAASAIGPVFAAFALRIQAE